MCGGCAGARQGDWLALVVRTRPQRDLVAGLVDSRAARVRASGDGWTVTSPTGRAVVAGSLTEVWTAITSMSVPEPDWTTMAVPAGFVDPAPAPDRRTPMSVIATDIVDARNQVGRALSAPWRQSTRIDTVRHPGAAPPVTVRVGSVTAAAVVASGMVAYGHSRGRMLEAAAPFGRRTVRLQAWDGHGLGFGLEDRSEAHALPE